MVIKNADIVDANFGNAVRSLSRKEIAVEDSLDLLTSIDQINARLKIIEQQKMIWGDKYVQKAKDGLFLYRENGDLLFKSNEDERMFMNNYQELLEQTFEIALKKPISISKKDRMSALDLSVLRKALITIID